MSSATALDGQGLRGIQQVDDWAYGRRGGDSAGRRGAGGGRGPQWNGQSGGRRRGYYLLLLLHPPTHSSIFLLSSAHALQKKRISVHIAISIVMPKYDQIDVGYCNTCERIGEEDACE